MQLARTRSLFFLAFIACALILGAAVYLQHAYGLEPCMLCHFQRSAIIGCGLVCLAATLHSPGPRGWSRYSLALLIIASIGAATAGGHVGLQTATPDQQALVMLWCESLLNNFWLDALVAGLDSELIFCAEINWSLFGISLPEWSLLAFVALMLLACHPLASGLTRRLAAEGRAGD